MAREEALGPPFPLYSRPWFLVGAGAGMTALGWIIGSSWPDAPALLRLLLLFSGFFTAVAGLIVRLRQDCWALAERIETAAMLASTGIACVLGRLGMDEDWESGRILFGALFLVALGGMVLVLLPPLARKLVLSLLVLFHFGGMVTAVTFVDPPGGTGPWVSKQLWTRVYNPYLTFLYLTNAYHFYSPDPGPPALFWFAVCYDDGSYTWVKLPERANSPTGMHYQRMLALPEHTFTPMPRLPFTRAECAAYKIQPSRDSPWEDILLRRELGSTFHYPLITQEDGQTVERHLPIPVVMGVADNLQYREPQDTSKRLIASVARRIFWTAPPPPREGVQVRSVKVYRVVHQLLTPLELSQGKSPLEKSKHWPIFYGEFDGQGHLKDSLEPFLYWYLPIAYVPKEYPKGAPEGVTGAPHIRTDSPPTRDTILLDCLEMHAAGKVPVRAKEEKKP